MRTIVVVPDPSLAHDLDGALSEFAEIEVVRRIDAYPQPEDLVRTIRARRPDFVFLSAEDLVQFQACAAVLDDRMPGLPVISVVREANPVELIPKLMHLGVREL